VFYGYPISQWESVLEWFSLMIVIGVFVFCISSYLGNKIMKKELNKNKIYETRTNKKKQIFFDVA
jgi:hypothetical protein